MRGPRNYTELLNEDGKFDRYAWPGGYEIFYVTQDNGLLCAACANENIELMGDPYDPQWNVTGCIVECEVEDDDYMTCDHCGYTNYDIQHPDGSYPDPEDGEDGEEYYNNMQSMRMWSIE